MIFFFNSRTVYFFSKDSCRFTPVSTHSRSGRDSRTRTLTWPCCRECVCGALCFWPWSSSDKPDTPFSLCRRLFSVPSHLQKEKNRVVLWLDYLTVLLLARGEERGRGGGGRGKGRVFYITTQLPWLHYWTALTQEGLPRAHSEASTLGPPKSSRTRAIESDGAASLPTEAWRNGRIRKPPLEGRPRSPQGLPCRTMWARDDLYRIPNWSPAPLLCDSRRRLQRRLGYTNSQALCS